MLKGFLAVPLIGTAAPSYSLLAYVFRYFDTRIRAPTVNYTLTTNIEP